MRLRTEGGPADASMEPRLVSRGNRSSRPALCLPPRCFNGAAARKPRKPPASTARSIAPRASMEPRLVSRGNSPSSRHHPSMATASMEPRLVSRGNPCLWAWAHPATRASMEPRLVSRGNSGFRAMVVTRPVGFNGAAARKPRKLGDASEELGAFITLQWSRGS